MALPTDGKLISSLGELDDLTSSGKSLLVQTSAGLKLMDAAEVFNWLFQITDSDNKAAAHNSIWCGRDLTSEFYDGTFSERVAAQTFDGIFPGGYITGQSSGTKYRVGDLNYYIGCGDTNCSTPHVLMFPEKVMYNAQMNSTNITTGGYIGSEMYTTNLATAKTTIKADFPDHVLSHRELFTNAVTNGYPSSGTWCDSEVDLMNECMVYGSHIIAPANYLGSTIPYNYTTDKSQIAAFRLCPAMVAIRANWWLRDVVSASGFAIVYSDGLATGNYASYSNGVRPAFLIY